MEYYNNQLCVSYDELSPRIINASTLKSNVTRHNIVCARRGGYGHAALYVFQSLPERYRMKFEDIYGDALQVLKDQQMKDEFVKDDEARRFYEEFEYDLNGVQTHLSQKLIDEYTLNASVMNMLVERLNDLKANSHALGAGRRSDLWDIVYAQSEKMRDLVGHTLPKNMARLKSKMNDYKKNGYQVMINGRIGNSNTLKITPEAAKMIIAMKRQKKPVLNNSQIFEEYNRRAEARGQKTLKSEKSLVQWLNSPAIIQLWYDAVHGELKAHTKFDRRHKTALPTMRDSLWYGDGTKVNLFYKDDQGKVRTTSVYEVIDAYSECFLGFCISDTEDYEAQYNAYRMAIQVAKHKPYEIVYDNQGGHKRKGSQDYFDNICHIHRTTTPYNGRSKTIESVFGRFQHEVLHKDWRFTGQNITTKKDDSRPNLEFIEANKTKLYTLDELKAAYVKARQEWNEMAHPATGISRIEMYENSVNEGTPEVTVSDMVDMFWVMASRPCTFTPSGLEITINKQKFVYDVYTEPGKPDYDWRLAHTYQKFYVKYDPYDPTSVRLYWKDKAGELRFERVAEPYMVVQRNIQEQNSEDVKFIREQEKAVAEMRIKRQVAARSIEQMEGTAPEQLGLNSPKLKGVSAAVNRQIERRTNLFGREPYELSVGKVTKIVSNLDWNEIEKPIKVSEKKLAGKL